MRGSPMWKFVRKGARMSIQAVNDNPCKDLGRTLPHIANLIAKLDIMDQRIDKLVNIIKSSKEAKT